MGLFDFKKKEPIAQQSRAPVDDVVRMRRQGLSNNQIVQALQRNGYPTHQIFDAFSQADLRPPMPMQGMPQQAQQPFLAPEQDALGMPPNLPPLEGDATINGPQSPEELSAFGQPRQQSQYPSAPQQEYGQYPTEDASAKIEEISEAIIAEKWQDLMKDFNKVLEWKSGVDQRVAAVEQRLTDLKAGFDSLQKSVIDKVGDYDKSVKDVGSEMKALEQVFQKIIPTLTENVNELSRITKGMKPADKKK